MKIRVPDYYKDFKCIADKCEDTCCAGWEVDVDDDSYEYYKTVTGPFGDRIKSVMVPPTEEEEACFTLNNGRCPFLNDNNLCDLYTELGEDKLCDTCTNYPRFIEEYGSLREIGIALSCKTAGELILKSDKKVTFELTENDEMVSTYNDIDPELYMMLMASRKTAFDIAQNRDFDIVMRYCLVLEYAKDIQDMIDKGTLSKIMNIKNNYSNEEYLRERTKTFNILHNEEYTRYSYIYEYLKIFDDFEIINKSWTDMVNHEKEYMYEQSSNEEYKSRYNRFEQYYHEKEYEYEQLLVYFIFRYYLKAVNDDDVFSKVKMAVVSFLIIKDLDVLRFCDNKGSLSFEALRDVDLCIEEGESVAIMGASGSGKSTLLNILGGMDKASRGKYYLEGEEISSYSEKQMARIRNEMFGFVMQDFALIERETVEKNVVLPLLYSKRFRYQKKARVEYVLREVGLYEKRHQPVTKLSGGQRQRVAIARALVNDASVLLCDEPTGALDRATGEEIIHRFMTLHAQGKTVIIVTHDEMVAKHCGRIIRIVDGRVEG